MGQCAGLGVQTRQCGRFAPDDCSRTSDKIMVQTLC